MNKGPRQPGEPELFGVKEVCAELDIVASNLATISGLPQPYQPTLTGYDDKHEPIYEERIAATTLYRADEIREFALVYKERRAAREARTAA